MFLIFLLFVRAAEPGPPPASPSIAHTVAQAVALGMLDYNEMMKQLSDAAGKIGQARTASVAAPLRDA
ncbi:MAG TPA: hypothetical protein PLA94_27105, partial [Myxococcota bacterium]|nr:hypothetical protein [Myxococcota bacterium]